MTLLKTTILSGISTTIKIITGFISLKVIAIFIGPVGLALIGQLQNFIGMISTIATGGISTGVVKYTAEFRENEVTKRKVWSSAINISLIVVFPISFLIAIFAKKISYFLLRTDTYSYVFFSFAFSLIFFVANNILISILNGEKEIKKLTIVNIISSLTGLLLTILLVFYFQLAGAMLAIIFSQSLVVLITFLFVTKSRWFNFSLFFGKFDKEYTIKLLKYSLMTLTAASLNPLSQIFLRNYIGGSIGWDEAGYWQAVWRISEAYLSVVTLSLSVYYMPKLSEIHDKKMLVKEILNGYKLIMPLVIIMALTIYLLKKLIILLLFTPEFLPMEQLFLWQLIGDVIKIASWLLGNILVAKAMTKQFIITEAVFVCSFVILSIFFMHFFGLIGITIGFAVNYTLYFGTLFLLLRRFFASEKLVSEYENPRER
ncbi:Lipopolysaccharide biosynthesis protein [[Clostridium] ultunense Esp]|nr:Lipopolysaccharide biosynthesis protein [[Clostridium] ultunense Esp]